MVQVLLPSSIHVHLSAAVWEPDRQTDKTDRNTAKVVPLTQHFLSILIAFNPGGVALPVWANEGQLMRAQQHRCRAALGYLLDVLAIRTHLKHDLQR